MDKIKPIGFKAGDKPRRPVIQADTSASKSYANIAYGVSEGEIVGLVDGLKSIYLDGTPVMSSAGDYNIPDVTVQTRNGTNSQEALEGFPAVVNEKNYNNLELKSDAPFVHYINDTQLDAVGVRITFGQIQQGNPDNGDVGGYTIKYAIEVQTDGQGYKELLRTEIVGKYASGYQRYHRIELPDAEEGWEVRVRRITPNSTSSYIADKMYIDAMAEILDVKMRYPNTALIGLKYDSERFNNIPKVDFRMRGKIIRVPTNYNPVERTYATTGAGTTNGVWDGSFKMAYTSNPAWIFYDIVLSKRYGLGNRIDASMLDKWSLYSIARYCDVMVPDGEGGMEPRFTCNVYLNNRYEAYDCLMQLSGVFRGIMYWSGTSIIAGCDRPQDPVYTYTRANILGEFNYSATRARDRHSVALVAFDDPSNNYKTDKEIVSDRKAIAEIGVRQLDMSAFACTSRGQAQRAGKWALLKEQLETRLVSFAVGLDGYIAPVGKVIEIADPLLAGRALGGRIAAVSADNKTITLDRDLKVKVGDRLVLNNEEGEQESRQVTSIKGRAVTVAVAFESPAVQNVWAVESDDLMLMKFTVLSVTENSSQDGMNFTITALQHEPELHAAADYSSYIDKSDKYSVIDIHTQKPPTNVVITSENRINQGIDITSLVISWKQAENAVKYQVQWRRDSGNWIQTPMQYGNQFTIDNVYHGTYEARVVAINAMEVNSTYANSAPTLIASKFAEPQTLATFTATGILFGITLDWRFPAIGAANAAYVEVHQAFNSNYSDSALLGSYAYPTDTATFNGLGANLTIHFKARLIDRNGVASEFTPWISATVRADPDQLLEVLNGHIGLAAIDTELSEAITDTATLAAEANALAEVAWSNADTARADATAAATKATAAAAAAAKEATDRAAAITAEATARTNAINKEASDRAAALTAQATTLKSDAAAKLAALKSEIDPKIATLQNGITTLTTDYKAGDTAVVGQLNAYKASNDTAVASVVQKAESAVATGATNSTAITAINGQITNINNNKLDASVITGYYTKGQTDAKAAEIAAGKVEEFSANLKIGGVNLLYDSALTDRRNWVFGIGSVIAGTAEVTLLDATVVYTITNAKGVSDVSLKQVLRDLSMMRGDTLTSSFTLLEMQGDFRIESKVQFRYTDSSYASSPITAVVPQSTGRMQFEVKPPVSDKEVNEVQYWITVRPLAVGSSARVVLHKPQLEVGSVATDWSPSPLDTKASLDANSTAIQTTDAEVRRVDGKIDATNSAVTALTGRVSTVEGAVSTKAEAAALNALTTRVVTEEGKSTSQGTAITNLQNTINHATTGLATKASTSALNATNSEVTRVNGLVTGHTSQLTALNTSITTINGELSKKADASALNDIYTKAQTDAKATEISAGQVSSFKAELNASGINLMPHTSASFIPPHAAAYYSGANYGTSLQIGKGFGENENCVRFKTNNVATTPYAYGTRSPRHTNIDGAKFYVLSAYVKSPVAKPIEVRPVTSTDGTSFTLRAPIKAYSLEADVWTRVHCVYEGSAPTAVALAMAFYINKDGAVVSDTNCIDVSRMMIEEAYTKDAVPSVWREGHGIADQVGAAASAIDTLNTSVSDINGTVTSVGNRTTALENTVNNASTGLASKAAASALTTLNNQVQHSTTGLSAVNTKADQLKAAIEHTTTGLATKASTTALTTVDNKVTAANGRIDAANSAATLLTGRVSTVEGALTTKADVSALSNIYTKAQADAKASEISAGKVEEFKAGLSIGGSNLLNNSNFAASASPDAWASNGGGYTKVDDATYGEVLQTNLPSGIVHAWIRLENATEYTYSALVKSSLTIAMTNSNPLHYHAGLNNVNQSKISIISRSHDSLAADTWTRISITFKLTGDADSFRPFIYASGSTGHIQLAWAKLERGNQATDWSPSSTDTIATLGSTGTNLFKADMANVRDDTVANARLGNTTASYWSVVTEAEAASGKAVKYAPLTKPTNTYTEFTPLNKNASFANYGTVSLKPATYYMFSFYARLVTNPSNGVFTFGLTLNYQQDAGASDYIRHLAKRGNLSLSSADLGNRVRIYGIIKTTARTEDAKRAVAYIHTNMTQVSSGVVNIDSFMLEELRGYEDGVQSQPSSFDSSSYEAFDSAAATASSLDTLTSRVSNAEGTLTSVGTRTTALENSVNNTTSGLASKASSSALTVVDNKVTAANGRIDTTNSAVTTLTGRVSVAEGELTKKATTQALDALTSRVSSAEGTLTSVSSRTTSLENAINHSTTGLATKAAASALTTLNNQVQHSTTGLSAVNTKVDNLKATIENSTNGLASKASSSALDTLSNKVNHSTTGLDAVANKTTALESELSYASAKKSFILATNRNGGSPAGFLGRGIYDEKKSRLAALARGLNLILWAADGSMQSCTQYDTYAGVAACVSLAAAIDALAANTHFTLIGADNVGTVITTHVALRSSIVNNGGSDSYFDQWKNNYLPIFTSKKGMASGAAIQHSFNSSVTSDWIHYLLEFVAGIPVGLAGATPIDESKFATASAVSDLTTRVSTAEGKITAEATKVSNLTTTVGGHTTTIATQTSTINGIQAKNTVKINNNGFISGYGLISTANNGAVVSAFKVDADAFAVGKSGSGILPFVVTTAGQTINGIKYPAAGTWINSAYIAKATIGLAHIDTATITNLSALSANLGTLVTLKNQSNPNGARMVMTGSLITVYDDSNRIRVKFGLW